MPGVVKGSPDEGLPAPLLPALPGKPPTLEGDLGDAFAAGSGFAWGLSGMYATLMPLHTAIHIVNDSVL